MCNPEPFCRRPACRGQRGVGLVELLVGMTLGLLVIAAAIGTLVVSRATASSISEISRLQQQGSFALRSIGMQLRQTGSVEPALDRTNNLYAFGAQFATYGATNASVSGSDGAGTAPDTLAVANLASAGLLRTQRSDCLGYDVAASARMQAQFSVKKRDSNALELACTSAGKTQSLIQNVADFQVAYRVATGTGTRIMDATDVHGGGLWGSVKAVEVCLALRGDELLPDAGASYLACNGTRTPRNGRIHLVFRNVFHLRTMSGRT